MRPTVALTLRMLLPDGRPAQYTEVHATPVAGEAFEIMRDDVFRYQEYHSDERGEVRIRGLDPAGRYELYVRPPYEPKGLVSARLTDWEPQNTEIRLVQKALLAGTVVDSQGVPQRRVNVWFQDSEGKRHWDMTGPSGSFDFDDLPPGAGMLGAAFAEEPASWDGFFVVPAEPGDEDVVVVLRSARDLTASFAADDLGGRLDLTLCLTRRLDADKEGPRREQGTDEDGLFRFRGLDPRAVYWLWAGPTPSGRYAYAEVAPAAEAMELRLALGGVVRGRVALPDKTIQAWSRIRERGISILSAVERDGTFQLVGVPPGEWTVTIECHTPDAGTLVGHSTAAAGETVEIELDR